MRVVYSIGAKFAGGGIGTTAYYAVRGLERCGYLHRLLCGAFRSTEIPTDKVRAIGLPNQVLRKLATFDTSGWLWYLQKILYDIWASYQLETGDTFHVWNSHGLSSLRRAKHLDMVTIVERGSSHPTFQMHILREEYARWGLRFQMPKPALRRSLTELKIADYVMIPSDFVQSTFLSVDASVKPRLLQVTRGVNTDQFVPVLKNPDEPFRLLFVGDISLRKGIPYLLEAWRQLGWCDAELWLAGRLQRTMDQLIQAQYADTPGIHLVGYVPRPVAVYQQADIFVFPTLEEGSAKVTYEALACGLPIVTTPNAGSVVRNSIEGFLVPIRDVEALASRLEELRRNESLRYTMSYAARQRALAFTWDRYVEQLVESMRSIHT